jgi:hypothetical protein
MDFIKKNYEKVLLGLVLVGLVVAVGFLFVLVSKDKSEQEERTRQIFRQTIRELAPPDISPATNLLKRASMPVMVDFSSTNKLFNPALWLKGPQGPYPVSTSSDLQNLKVLKTTPLFLIITLDQVNASESGVRYGIGIEEQAASSPGKRTKRPFYVSIGEKKEFGENKDTFQITEVRGPTNEPTELVLELSDSADPIVLSKEVKEPKEKPYTYKRVEDYSADLKYAFQTSPFLNRRRGDKISIPQGEEYNIVAIKENEVVLSAKSNNKKTTIQYNASP